MLWRTNKIEKPVVYDFLYNDSSRVAAYLSQITGRGAASSIRYGSKVSTNRLHGLGTKLSAFGLGASVDTKKIRNEEKNNEVTSDPLWSNAICFLSEANKHDLISNHVAGAKIGGLVSVTGKLSIANFHAFRELTESQSIRDKIEYDIRSNVPSGDSSSQGVVYRGKMSGTNRKQDQVKEPTIADIMVELFHSMPPHISFMLHKDHDAFWGTLDPSKFLGIAEDTLLGHGTDLFGEWTVVGTLDGLPTPEPELLNDEGESDLAGDEDLEGPDYSVLARKMVCAYSDLVRVLSGRANECYAVKPMLIYRRM